MYTLTKYNTGNFQKFFDDLEKYTIGMDEWLNRFNTLSSTETNYPPYNVVRESDVEYRLEVALAGFKKNEVTVYTENNKLFVEGHKEVDNDKEYVHRGVATRAFNRYWTISDDVEVNDVSFEDGMLIVKLCKVIPEHQKKKVWF